MQVLGHGVDFGGGLETGQARGTEGEIGTVVGGFVGAGFDVDVVW